MLTNSRATLLRLLGVWLAVCALLIGLLALTGCEKQQNMNKKAFENTKAKVIANPDFKDTFDHMVYEREEVDVYIKPGPGLLEDKGKPVMFVAKTMGDELKANPDNKLTQLMVKGYIENEELWEVRYDMKTGEAILVKSREVTTM